MEFVKHKMYCPVCRTLLGSKYNSEFYTAHCNECKTTFTWWPKKHTPKALLDKDRKERCKCGRCN